MRFCIRTVAILVEGLRVSISLACPTHLVLTYYSGLNFRGSPGDVRKIIALTISEFPILAAVQFCFTPTGGLRRTILPGPCTLIIREVECCFGHRTFYLTSCVILGSSRFPNACDWIKCLRTRHFIEQ